MWLRLGLRHCCALLAHPLLHPYHSGDSLAIFWTEYVVVESQPFARDSKEDGTPFPFGVGFLTQNENHLDPGNACSKEQSWELGCLALLGYFGKVESQGSRP